MLPGKGRDPGVGEGKGRALVISMMSSCISMLSVRWTLLLYENPLSPALFFPHTRFMCLPTSRSVYTLPVLPVSDGCISTLWTELVGLLGLIMEEIGGKVLFVFLGPRC